MHEPHECSQTGCGGTAAEGWSPGYPSGCSGWAHNTNGAGSLGMASRAHAVYAWAYAQSANRLCANAHSSGTGRLMLALTRYGAAEFFEAIVFDGGPVWTYFPWVCGNAGDGPLGPLDPEYNLTAPTGFRTLYDCCRTEGVNEEAIAYDACRTSTYDGDAYLGDSNFIMEGSARDFPDLEISIVLGSDDLSPAQEHARLWFAGYEADRLSIPPITAREVTLTQGYCPNARGTYNTGVAAPRPCSDWSLESLPGLTAGGYDRRLVGVSHSTTEHEAGAAVVGERMLATCDAI